jgi:hypothetical protein
LQKLNKTQNIALRTITSTPITATTDLETSTEPLHNEMADVLLQFQEQNKQV